MSDSDRRRHAIEVAHNAYHEHNDQCACRTVGHLTEWIANAVYDDVAYIRFTLPRGLRWLASAHTTTVGPPPPPMEMPADSLGRKS